MASLNLQADLTCQFSFALTLLVMHSFNTHFSSLALSAGISFDRKRFFSSFNAYCNIGISAISSFSFLAFWPGIMYHVVMT